MAGHGEKEGVWKVEVGVAELPREIVADPESEVETVEAMPREHVEIGRPERSIVEPRFVFDGR
jgi:hypothetical protein